MSSHDTVNPTGGVNMGHVMESPDPNDHLLERVLSRENMRRAWKRVKANKGAPGIDNKSVEDLPEIARKNWDSIRESLLAGTYQPLPVLRVEIPKATGGTRPLGIPTVLDRLIQQAMYQVLMPIFDPEFSDHSYGFRPGRSAHNAVRKVREYIREGYRTAVDLDLSQSENTCVPGSWSTGVCRKLPKGFPKEARCHHFWPTSYSMIWIKSLNVAVTASCVMPMISLFW